MRQRLRQVVEHEGGFTGHQRGGRRNRAAVRHVNGLGAGAHPKHLTAQVRGLPDAGGGEAKLPRPALEFRDQVRDRPDRGLRVDHQYIGEHDQIGERDKIRGAIGQLLVGAVVDGVGTGIARHQGVAVCRRPEQCLHADDATASGAVVDDDRLAQQGSELLCHEAGRNVDGASRRARNDDGDRPLRPGCCSRRRDGGRACSHQQQPKLRLDQLRETHGSSPPRGVVASGPAGSFQLLQPHCANRFARTTKADRPPSRKRCSAMGE
ncbi:hypothetical protein D3C72_1468440 [compost metagenome]